MMVVTVMHSWTMMAVREPKRKHVAQDKAKNVQETMRERMRKSALALLSSTVR